MESCSSRMEPRRWLDIVNPQQMKMFDTWKNNVSDLLLIQKEGTDLFRAANFFRNELDEDIPFAKMGFLNLFEFFFHCKDVIQLRAKRGKYFLFFREEACPKEQRHLRQLAKGQASSRNCKVGIGQGIQIRPTIANTQPVSIHNLLTMNPYQMSLNRVPTASASKPSTSSRGRSTYGGQRNYQSKSRFQNQKKYEAPPRYGRNPQLPRQPSSSSFVPGPPTHLKSQLQPPPHQARRDIKPSYSSSSDESYSEVPSYTYKPKYGMGENAHAIPAFPFSNLVTGNSTGPNTTVAPIGIPKIRPLVALGFDTTDTVDSSSSQRGSSGRSIFNNAIKSAVYQVPAPSRLVAPPSSNNIFSSSTKYDQHGIRVSDKEIATTPSSISSASANQNSSNKFSTPFPIVITNSINKLKYDQFGNRVNDSNVDESENKENRIPKAVVLTSNKEEEDKRSIALQNDKNIIVSIKNATLPKRDDSGKKELELDNMLDKLEMMKFDEEPKLDDDLVGESKKELARMNKDKLEMKLGRKFSTLIFFNDKKEGEQFLAVCYPLPKFINHVKAIVYVPLKKRMMYVKVADIKVAK